jgi:hypothetical protein
MALFPGDGTTAFEIKQAADAAMYVAKRAGGSRICAVSSVGSELALATTRPGSAGNILTRSEESREVLG